MSYAAVNHLGNLPVKTGMPRGSTPIGLVPSILGLFLIGFVTRLALALPRLPDTMTASSEPVAVALSLFHNGTYADAYGAGVGPTAHCMPLHPLILAAVFHLFGTGRSGAFMASALASAAAAMAYAILPALALIGGFGRRAGLLAAAAGALLPLSFWAQTSGVFDAPYTMVLLVALCYVMSRCWIRASFTAPQAALLGFVGAAASLCNAAIFPVLIAWFIAGTWCFRARLREYLQFTGLTALVVAALFSPWVIRNYLTFGRPILTRSNFGLELQLSNNDLATADLEKNVRNPELYSTHPFISAVERDKVRQIGEIAYQRARQQQAVAWIAGHPGQFGRLVCQRIFYFWFPPMARGWQTLAEAGLTILGGCGLLSLLTRRHVLRWVFTSLLLGYSAIYVLIQVSPRYRCPIEPFLILLGSYWLSGICSRTGAKAKIAVP